MEGLPPDLPPVTDQGPSPSRSALRVGNGAFSLFLVGAALAAALVTPVLAALPPDLPPITDPGPSPSCRARGARAPCAPFRTRGPSTRHREERSDEAIPPRLEGHPHDLPPVTDPGPSPRMAPGVRGPLVPASPPRGRDETAPLATGQRDPRWGPSRCVQLPGRRGRPRCTASTHPPRLRAQALHAASRPPPILARSLVADAPRATDTPSRLARPVTRSLRRDGPRTPGAGFLPPPTHAPPARPPPVLARTQGWSGPFALAPPPSDSAQPVVVSRRSSPLDATAAGVTAQHPPTAPTRDTNP